MRVESGVPAVLRRTAVFMKFDWRFMTVGSIGLRRDFSCDVPTGL